MKRARRSAVAPPASAAVPRPSAAVPPPPVVVHSSAAAAPPLPAVPAVAPQSPAVDRWVRPLPYKDVFILYEGKWVGMVGAPANRRFLRRQRAVVEELGGKITIDPQETTCVTSYLDCIAHVDDAIKKFKEYMIGQGLAPTMGQLMLTPRETIPLSVAHLIQARAADEAEKREFVLNRTTDFKMKLKLYAELMKRLRMTKGPNIRQRIKDTLKIRSTVVIFE